MKIKNGVRFATGEQAMLMAGIEIERIYEKAGFHCELTGGAEGRRPNNLHHRGWALDFKMNHVDEERSRLAIANEARAALGDGFDVVLHGEGLNIHLHVEYDPKD